MGFSWRESIVNSSTLDLRMVLLCDVVLEDVGARGGEVAHVAPVSNPVVPLE